ncbi:MAG: hypothetical protein LKJ17_11225 [Oscillospiraceae bacterium]|jgi:hypothetical protein|nr:hypothetical protein [Oscillospiraceae bacterium]
MNTSTKPALQSKLLVYLNFYRLADKQNNQERKAELEPYIEDLREEIKKAE